MTPQLEKSLQIAQAKEGESIGIPTLDTYEKFKKELDINSVDDIFTDTQIKKDQTKNIFIIGGMPKFTIDERKLEEWTQNFYNDKQQKDIDIRISEVKGILTLEYIKNELGGLKEKAENTSIENIKWKIDRLITFFDQEKDLTNENIGWFLGRKYNRKDTQLFKIGKVEINRRLNQLKKIKKQIERLEKNKDKKYTIKRENDGKVDVEMDDINGYDMTTTLSQFNQRIEELGKEAPEFIKSRNEIILENGDTTPYFEYIIKDVQDATALKLSLQKINDYDNLLNRMALSADKRQAIQQDLEALRKYLENYMNNPNTFDPAKEPFIAKSGSAFQEFCRLDPELNKLAQLNTTAGAPSEGVPNPTYPETQNNTTRTNPENAPNYTNPGDTKNYADKGYVDTFKEGGVTGVIRKTLNMFPNMSNQSKNTWTNLLVVGGVGFGVFKLAKWLFTGRFGKKVEGKTGTPRWQRLLIVGGVTLGFNAFGSNPLSAAEKFIGGGLDFNTLKIQWPWAASEKVDDPEKELTYIELNEVFGNLPIKELKKFIDPKTFKMTEEGHNGLLRNFQGTDANSKAKRDLIEKIRKNNDNDILKTSFAKVGITPENIDNLNQEKTVKQYTESLVPTVEGGVDSRDNIDDPKINITEQVKSFNITEDQKKNLIKYGNILYDEKPGSSTQKVEFVEKDTKIYLKTYDERTPIDIEKLTITGYQKKDTSPIVFSGYTELLKAANLTNYMKSIFRGKAKGNKYEPFEAAGLVGKLTWDRGDIMFNDGTSKYNPIHTEAIDGGRFGTLGKISPKMEDNKEEYINYLNKLNIRNETRATESKPA